MKLPQTEDWTAAATVDASGLRCPLPVLRARKALLPMPSGARLILIATDPLAGIDVPHFCAEAGHRLIATDNDGKTHRFLIERN